MTGSAAMLSRFLMAGVVDGMVGTAAEEGAGKMVDVVVK